MAGPLERNLARRLMALLAAFGVGAVLLLGVAPAGAQSDEYPVDEPPEETSVQRATLEQVDSGGALPRTGGDVAPWIISGVVLVGLGTGIVVLARRRSDDHDTVGASA